LNTEKPRFYINHMHFDSPLDFKAFKLIQAGRRYCERGESVKTHWQGEYYEITVVTDGSGYISTNGVETLARAGDIYISFPFELHSLRTSGNGKFEYDFLSFSPGPTFKEDFERLNSDFYDPSLRVFKDERISELVAMIVFELSGEKLYGNELVASIFNQIAIYTLRRFAKTERSTPNISEAEIFCQQIMTYIDTHIYSLTKLSELSDQFGYNYTYISSLFKKTTGNTLLDYYCKRKLTIAQAMLNEGKFTIARIADKLGYSSPFAFSAAFKKAYGISPKKYKEAHKQ